MLHNVVKEYNLEIIKITDKLHFPKHQFPDSLQTDCINCSYHMTEN